MAIYHNSVSVIKRSAGRSAVAAAAYRSGNKLTDERTGLIHNYRRKTGVDYSVILTPINADWITDRQQLWNRVEAAERRCDARLAKEITLAIPVELSRDDKIALVSEYIQKNFVDSGMIADINFHGLDSNNPHCHIMVTTRDLKVDDKGEVTFGNKNRSWDDWNHTDLLVKNREDWAKLSNQYLVNAGYPDIQIDHCSNANRGIETLPQIHLGFHVAAMRKKGLATERGDEYNRILIANDNICEKLEKIYESEAATRDLEHQLLEFDRKVRDRSQFYEKIEIPKEVKESPHPAYPKLKWSSKKDIDPQLVRAIMQMGDKIGADYDAGNYQLQIDVAKKEIKVKYKNNLAMIVYPSTCDALLIDHTYTIKQYEQGLKGAIDVLMTDLEQQRQTASEQLEQSEQPRQAEPEPEQLEQSEQELELSHDTINDSELVIDDPKIDFTKPLISQNLSRSSRSDWNL